MSFQHASTAALILLDYSVERIAIEAVVRPGLPQLRITGMAAGPARDTAERIRAVVHSLGLRLPPSSILLHLSPGDLAKRGAYLDLPLLATLLVALGVPAPGTFLEETWDGRTLYLGEVGLDGTLRSGRALLPLLAAAREHGFVRAVLPESHAAEARLCSDVSSTAIRDIGGLLRSSRPAVRVSVPESPPELEWAGPIPTDKALLRGLMAAAAGAHPLLMIGPPGTGKTTMAGLLHALLPRPRRAEQIEHLALQSLLDRTRAQVTSVPRPFRSPHHSVTSAGLVGGGRPLLPGEATLAHGGLLFIDELGEVQREALQSLREPLELHRVHLARGGGVRATLPARFWFAAASNPCPCGFSTAHRGQCVCTAASIRSYLARIRGPLQDRIDIQLQLANLPDDHRSTVPVTLSELRRQVERAEEQQRTRFADGPVLRNGELDGGSVDEFASLSRDVAEEWSAIERGLNRRGRAGVRRLARTLADLSGVAEIRTVDLYEAMHLRDPTVNAQSNE